MSAAPAGEPLVVQVTFPLKATSRSTIAVPLSKAKVTA